MRLRPAARSRDALESLGVVRSAIGESFAGETGRFARLARAKSVVETT
jgi:hypothetical protein